VALLSAADEARVWRGLMRFWSSADSRQLCIFAKADLLAAVQDMNAYLDGAALTRPATSINSAFPIAFRNGATVDQKGQVVAAITLAQTGNIDWLRRILGEVD